MNIFHVLYLRGQENCESDTDDPKSFNNSHKEHRESFAYSQDTLPHVQEGLIKQIPVILNSKHRVSRLLLLLELLVRILCERSPQVNLFAFL